MAIAHIHRTVKIVGIGVQTAIFQALRNGRYFGIGVFEMIDKRVVKTNHMSDDEIRSLLLAAVLQGLQKKAGYIAPVSTEIEVITFGDSPLDGFHTYVQNMRKGEYYTMLITASKTNWMLGIFDYHFKEIYQTDFRYVKFLLLTSAEDNRSG